MSAIVDVVLPIFAIVLCGYLAGWRGLLGAASSDALNGFVYYFALPILLFKAMAQVDPAIILNAPYIAAYVGGQVVTLVIDPPPLNWSTRYDSFGRTDNEHQTT